MRIKSLATHQAIGARPAQEDHVLVRKDKGILVVADGFGGPEAGVAAARAASEAVSGFLYKEAGDLDATLPFVLRSYFSLAGNVLFNALIHANRKVRDWNKGKAVHQRGGAAVVAAFMDGDLLALANAGGCTAWLLREGQAAELVVPRTYGRLVDPFVTTRSAPDRSAPLTALGCAEDVEPEILEVRLRPGDWILLATDGVPPAELAERLRNFQKAADFAAADAWLKGYLPGAAVEDNASALLVAY